MTIPQESFESYLLIDGCDHWTGLYEVIWLANTWFPEENLGFEYGIGEASIRSLLKQGRIELAKRRPPWAVAASPEEGTISPEEWDAIISNPSSWYPCNSDNFLISNATEQGRLALEAGSKS